jgi:hypothetical protein
MNSNMFGDQQGAVAGYEPPSTAEVARQEYEVHIMEDYKTRTRRNINRKL